VDLIYKIQIKSYLVVFDLARSHGTSGINIGIGSKYGTLNHIYFKINADLSKCDQLFGYPLQIEDIDR
jgi:hypothetical protein